MDLLAVADIAGAVDEDERDLGPDALLVARRRGADGRGVAAVLEPRRQPGRFEQLGDLRAQRVLPRQPQRGEDAEAEPLAVAVGRVARGRLDRVADRVAEVEDLAQA